MKKRIEKAWCKETAHPSYQKNWTPDNPSCGQCCVTALLIQEKIGGEIYSCKVRGYNNTHYINIINDRIIDLTAGQFGGISGITYLNDSFKIKDRKTLLKNKSVKERYELLKKRYEEVV